MRALVISVLLAGVVAGCVTPRITASVEAASRLKAAHAGHTVAVKVADAKGETTLLLDSLAPLIGNELAARGFMIVEDAATADLVALATLTLGISERGDGGRRVVFEGRLRSNGGCGSLTKVGPYLVQGMFEKFPTGGTGEVVVPSPDLDC